MKKVLFICCALLTNVAIAQTIGLQRHDTGSLDDGYPIYGAYAYTNTNGTGAITRMKSSYQLRTNTTRANGPAQIGQDKRHIYYLTATCYALEM